MGSSGKLAWRVAAFVLLSKALFASAARMADQAVAAALRTETVFSPGAPTSAALGGGSVKDPPHRRLSRLVFSVGAGAQVLLTGKNHQAEAFSVMRLRGVPEAAGVYVARPEHFGPRQQTALEVATAVVPEWWREDEDGEQWRVRAETSEGETNLVVERMIAEPKSMLAHPAHPLDCLALPDILPDSASPSAEVDFVHARPLESAHEAAAGHKAQRMAKGLTSINTWAQWPARLQVEIDGDKDFSGTYALYDDTFNVNGLPVYWKLGNVEPCKLAVMQEEAQNYCYAMTWMFYRNKRWNIVREPTAIAFGIPRTSVELLELDFWHRQEATYLSKLAMAKERPDQVQWFKMGRKSMQVHSVDHVEVEDKEEQERHNKGPGLQIIRPGWNKMWPNGLRPEPASLAQVPAVTPGLVSLRLLTACRG